MLTGFVFTGFVFPGFVFGGFAIIKKAGVYFDENRAVALMLGENCTGRPRERESDVVSHPRFLRRIIVFGVKFEGAALFWAFGPPETQN